MKIIDQIRNKNRALFSFEILPPLKGQSVDSIFKCIDKLIVFNPSFICVTYHREQYVYKIRENGLLEKRKIRKRPGTVGICAAIKNKYQIETIPHLICGGFTRQETEDALIDLKFLGIENILVLRGDSLESQSRFVPHKDGHTYASELLQQIINMNQGIYLEEDIQEPSKSDFCTGIAGYPEKHFESPNAETDIRYMLKKIQTGAQYSITQMFFDNQKYFDFYKQCQLNGIKVPIIPGLKPIERKNQIVSLPRNFHITIPQDLVNRVEQCKNDKEVKKVGQEWCIQQSKELIEFGAPCIHYYSMGNAETIYQIVKTIF